MRNLLLACVVALVLCPAAMAVDIAISTQAGWFGQGAADREMQEIVDNVTGASIEVFTASDQAALATWVKDHTGDGLADLLILCGQFPSTIYTPGNSQADGSIAELFLDDGNTIINTGDYMFYVVDGAGTNGEGGIRAMMDNPTITMWDNDTQVTVTVDGQDFTPTLQNFASDRPFHLNELQGDWEPELILAQNAAGTRADPVIVRNRVTGGRLGIFYQTAGQDDDPRGEVISEWINNWYLSQVGGGGYPFARRPVPEDGAKLEQTWVNLSWDAGYYAVSHDVYLGESFDDVNDATTASPVYQGNHTDDFILAGFFGYPLPDGLVPGTTYYWRIDEVNDANAASPWKGKVWSFWIPPTSAYAPSPADGGRFVNPAPKLTWSAGFNAKIHYVNFGDNFDNVSNAPAGTGTPASSGSFTPPGGPLQPEKTYYWRVDAVNPPITTKGDVWSFTVAKEGGGVLADYFKGMNFDTYVLTRTDPEINFNWGDPGGPDPLVGNDQFSCRWTGEVEAAFTETYRFYAAADDGVRLWVDGVQLVNAWIDQGTTEYSGTIDLVAGNTYAIVMEQYENGGGATAYLRWSSPHTPKQIIPSAALSPPVRARSPRPANGAVGVTQTPTLAWGAGVDAASHEVYFGTDAAAVAAATKASPEYAGSKQLGAESYETPALEWNTTYYWRVDEVNATNPDSPWAGNTWSFTTADYGVVEDFEAFNDIESGQPGSKLIYETWIDGYGTTTNGSYAGYIVPFEPTMEDTFVHGGNQSAPMGYNNATATISEITRTFAVARDWTANGILTLSIWFYGNSANVPGQLYAKINGVQVLYDGDAANLTIPAWQVWNIDLSKVGTNLQSVTSLAVGVQGFGATGVLLLDDIGLYPYPRELITPVQPDPTGLLASWQFDGNYNDSSGNGHTGTPNGAVSFAFDPVRGQVLSLPGGDNQFVDCGSVGISGNAPRTIACWAKADNTNIPDWTLIFGFTGTDTGAGGNGSHFNIGSLGGPGGVGAHCWGWEETIFSDDAALSWHHYAMTYDGTTIQYYGDGVLMDSDPAKSNVRSLAISADRVHVGSRITQASSFPGDVDDARVYDRVLSIAEIAGLAGKTQPFDKPLGN